MIWHHDALLALGVVRVLDMVDTKVIEASNTDSVKKKDTTCFA